MIHCFTQVEAKYMLEITIITFRHKVKKSNQSLNNEDSQKTQ
jgi:hypothetical protein